MTTVMTQKIQNLLAYCTQNNLHNNPTSNNHYLLALNQLFRGHSGRVVTFSPPMFEAGVWFLAWPQMGKLVVACRWSAVYSTEP